MNEGVQSRRVYIKEFKEETIGLILNRGMSVSQVSKDLSIGTETLYRWIRQYCYYSLKVYHQYSSKVYQ